MDITKALEFGWPGKQWSVSDTYKSLVCYDFEKPTEEEIASAWDSYVLTKQKTEKRLALISQLDDTLLRIKRAELEPGQHPSGVTYLEFYTAQYRELRAELKSL